MKAETLVLRVRVASRGLQVNLAKLARGVVPEPTAPVGCPESPVPRATEASMDFPGCPAKRDTGVSRGRWDRRVPPERTDREARMERSDPEDWLVRAALEVCWGPVVLQAPQDPPVLLELTDLQVPKETWVLKESQVLQVSRASQEHRVFPALRVPSVHPEKKDLRAGQGYLDYLELMGLLAILVRRVHLEKREHRVLQVRRVRLVILDPAASREPMVSVV